MGKDSGIQWTHHSFNPWIGCTKVSPGCTNCYAEALDKRWGGAVDKRTIDEKTKHLRWGPNGLRTRTEASNWRKPLRWNFESHASKRRDRVFTASLADVFEENDRFPLDVWRLELFDLIHKTPDLDWLVLTKRPQNIRSMLQRAHGMFERTPDIAGTTIDMLERWHDGRPPHNVWLGTTVEDQQRADERIHHLKSVPARVHFLSCEPLLAPVNLKGYLHGIDWVIIGGESGAKARPFDLEWARRLIWQLQAAGVAPFMKQMGQRPVDSLTQRDVKFADLHGGDIDEWPQQFRVREFPR